jgi:hypothetical protein
LRVKVDMYPVQASLKLVCCLGVYR